MAGPWEEYAQPAASGPWDEYAAPTAAAVPESDGTGQHIEVVNGVPTYVKGNYKTKKKSYDINERAIGLGEAGLQTATGLIGGVAGPIAGLAEELRGGNGDQKAGEVMQGMTYQPRTELGQEYGDAVGNVVNNLLPLAPVHLPNVGKQFNARLAKQMPEISRPESVRVPPEPVVEAAKATEPKGPWNDYAQTPVMQVTPEGQAFDPRNVPDIARQRAAEMQRHAQDALDRSTQDITYENVPPDGVIPRSRPDGSLRVPSRNEWVADENGIPVRQGMPEEPLVKDSQNVNVDQPHVNDMGNAIQEANGPKLGPDEIYGAGQLKVPSGQRGAIDVTAFEGSHTKDLGDGIRGVFFQRPGFGPTIRAVKDGKTVGELRLNTDTIMPKPSSNLEAAHVFVDPELRGTGVAEKMYKFASEIGDVQSSSYLLPDGRKMWEGFEKRGVANSDWRIPKSQRGAIDLGEAPRGKKEIAELTPDHPSVVAAASAMDKRMKGNMVKDVLGTPYEDNILSPEEVVALAPKAKDITKFAKKRGETGGAGINAAVMNSNNPLLKRARFLFRSADHEAAAHSEKWITGPDGLARKWQKLNEKDRNEVMAALMKQDRQQRWYTPKELEDASFTSEQINVISHIKEMEKAKLDIWNEKRAAAGKKPIEERQGHFPGNFVGDYRTLVLDKDKNVVGFIGTKTRWGHSGLKDELQKQYPDHTFVDFHRKGLADMGNGAFQTGMSELAKILAENDPKFAELQSKVRELMATEADKLYGADKHALGKKGIWGSEGNKPWRTATENTTEAIKAYKDYWDEGMRSHTLLPAEVEIKSLMNNPSLAHMPNAIGYLEKYMLNQTGRSAAMFARGMDNVLDTFATGLGVGPSSIRLGTGKVTKHVGQILMGLGNYTHTLVQLFQYPQMAVPEIVNFAKTFGLGTSDAMAAQGRALGDHMSFLKEMLTEKKSERDPYTRAMMDFAEHSGMRHFSEFQDISKTNSGKVSRMFDDIADFNRTVPEVLTRPLAFFTMARMLENDPHMTFQEKMSAALNGTDAAMVNYSPREKPMFYRDLGQMGKLTGSLMTFKHTAWSQYGRLVNQAKKGNYTPLAVSVAMAYALSGMKGVMGYDDADSLVKWITKKAGKEQSIRELALDPYIASEMVKSGVLSTVTGVDFGSRLNVGQFVADNPLEALAGPAATKAGSIGKAGYKAAQNLWGEGRGPIDFKNLALELMPGGAAKTNLRETLMNNPETNRLTGKDALPGNDRTPEDIAINKAGFTSLRQANLNNAQYMDTKRSIAKAEKRKSILDQAVHYYAQGMLEDKGEELFKRFLAVDGTKDQWVNHLKKEGIDLSMSKQQRLQGIPKGNNLESIYKYQNYEPSRKYNNAD